MDSSNSYDQAAAYVEARAQLLRQTTPLFERKTFSFDQPHTCIHCQTVAVTVSSVFQRVICQACVEVGNSHTIDLRSRTCTHCGAHYDQTVQPALQHTACPPLNFSTAITASQSGCALYEWLVDVFVYNVAVYPTPETPAWRTHAGLLTSAPAFYLATSRDTFDPEGNNLCEMEVFVRTWKASARSGSLPTDDPDQLWDRLRSHEVDILSQIYTAAGKPDLDRAIHWSFNETLLGWATADPQNGAARYISSRPYGHDVASAESRAWIKNCLTDCVGTHELCRWQRQDGMQALPKETWTMDEIPARLLDVTVGTGPHASCVRLVETHEADASTRSRMMSAGYAALSYCWGGDQPVKLTKTSHSLLQVPFPPSNLPQTLCDAIAVARDLGIPYLWIDALCILQDDRDDQAREISRMAAYYQCAAMTICAASSMRCTDGFFHRRETASFHVGPIRLPYRDEDGKEIGALYVLKEALDNPARPEKEPTTTRAWTLQESLLSRRLLIFGRKQVYWSCTRSYGGFGGHKTQMIHRVSGNRGSHVDNIHTLGSLAEEPTDNQWARVVRQFTRRQLGFAADKLPAVSALAANLQKTCDERDEDTVYAAGLFVPRKSPHGFLSQLLWTCDRAKSTRTAAYRAPSWSWVAVEGPFYPDPFSLARQDIPSHVRFRLEHVQVELESEANPFGRVTGGVMILRARVLPLASCRLEALTISFDDDWDYTNAVHEDGVYHPIFPKEGGLGVMPDTPDDESIIQAAMAGNSSRGEPALLYLWHGEIAACGLMVLPVADNTYRRLGTFAARRPNSGDALRNGVVLPEWEDRECRLI